MPQLTATPSSPAVLKDTLNLPPALPGLPDDVKKRFPSMQDWEDSMAAWYKSLVIPLEEDTSDTSDTVSQANQDIQNLYVSANGLTASITTERTARIDGDTALATEITTVIANYTAADAVLTASITTESTARASADTALATSITSLTAVVGTKAKITVSNSAPSSPAVNDLWLDTSDMNKYKFWDGSAWQYKQDLVLAASVTTESTARATADGNLSGKYTLTVAAGNVVTGMNITSSSGGGVNISDVTFVATNFKIYNSVTGITMFNVSGTDVQLASTLTVSTTGKVYIGTGTFNNTNTAFYVDSTGQFSLKNSLSWDGTTLTINGVINSTSGMIGGFAIGANTLIGGSGSSKITLNATGSSGFGVVAGDFSGGNRTMSFDSTGFYVWEGINVIGQLKTVGASGSRAGFLELFDSLGNANIILGGDNGQVASLRFSVGTYAGTPALAVGDGYMNGNLFINTTVATPGFGNTNTGFYIEAANGTLFASRAGNFCGSFNRNSDGSLVIFARSGTQVGSVSVTTTNTAFNTSSDRRLKMNIVDAENDGKSIDRVRVREYEFASCPGRRRIGFIAQELVDEFPDAVTRGDDGDDIEMQWQVDYSKLVPALFLEVQDLRRRLKLVENS